MNLSYIGTQGVLLAQDGANMDPSLRVSLWLQIVALVRDRIKNTTIWDGVLVLAIVFAAVALTWVFTRWRRRVWGPSKNPEGLFRELCQAHSLGKRANHLLRSLAAAHEQKPAMMFVMPQFFKAEALPTSLKPYTKEFQELARHLFS